MNAPLFWLLLEVESVVPCPRAYSAGGYGAELLGFSDETVVRPGLPVPIGSRLGEIAESLFALSKRLLGLLALRDIHQSADKFNRTVGGCIKDWVRHQVNKLDGAIRKNNSVVQFVSFSFRQSFLTTCRHVSPILRMVALSNCLE